jgi:hypothetical protein
LVARSANSPPEMALNDLVLQKLAEHGTFPFSELAPFFLLSVMSRHPPRIMASFKRSVARTLSDVSRNWQSSRSRNRVVALLRPPG